MASEYVDISKEEYEEVLRYVGGDFKEFFTSIYEEKAVTVAKLAADFEVDHNEILTAIGTVNGKIYKKHGVAIYPSEVNGTIASSVYAIGKLV